jgi:O-antigen/teichoic acid export membrane protein
MAQNGVSNHLHMKTMAKAAGLSFVAVLFSKVASYAFRWVGAKLGTAEYGAFAMAFGVFEVVAGLSLLGVDATVNRFIVDDQAASRMGVRWNSFWYGMKLALTSAIIFSLALALCSGWIATRVLRIPELSQSLLLFAITIPFFIFVLVFVVAARGLKRVEYEAGAKNVLESALRPIIAFCAIAMGLGVLGLSVSVFASAILVFLACVYWASKLFPQDWLHSLVNARKPAGFFRFSLPIYASNLLSIVIANASIFSLGLMLGASEAGIFSALMPLALFITLPTTAVLSIFVSVGSELLALGKSEASEKLYKSISKAILLLTIPLSVVLAFFSRESLTFLYLVDYSQGAVALSILSVAYLFYSVFVPAQNYLHVLKRTDLLLWNLVASSLVVVASIFLFVPTFGTVGAAMAFSAGLLMQAALPVLEVRRFTGMHPFSGPFVRTFLAGCLALVPLFFSNGAFGLRGINRVVFGAALYCAAYFALLFLLRCLDRDDIELLKSVERRSGIALGPVRGALKRFYFGSGK